MTIVLLPLATGLAGAAPRQHRRSHAHAAKSPLQLRRDLANLKGRKAQLRAELKATRKKARVVKEDLNTVDAKLENVKSRLGSTRSRLSSERVEQKKVSGELVTTDRELARTRKQVRLRLREIYMAGQTSGLSALVGTADAGEMASRGALMGTIEKKDRELFNRYTELQKETEDHKKRQDQLVAEVAGLAAQEQGETRELAGVRQEKGEVLDGLREKQGEIQDEIRQFDADEAEITAQIEAYARMHAGGRGLRRGQQLPEFTGRFSRPVDAPITSGFGMRYHPILHIVRMHTGVDFGAPIGTPIHAAADGNVIATTFMRGYGHVVIIDHGGGVSTVYAHTSAVYCSPGEFVHRGQVIAAVGNSGLSTGPHLHFEVRISGHPVNPLRRL